MISLQSSKDGVQMAKLSDYSRADTTAYYYTTSEENARKGVEQAANGKADLLAAINADKVFSFRKETSQFYFLESENK